MLGINLMMSVKEDTANDVSMSLAILNTIGFWVRRLLNLLSSTSPTGDLFGDPITNGEKWEMEHRCAARAEAVRALPGCEALKHGSEMMRIYAWGERC